MLIAFSVAPTTAESADGSVSAAVAAAVRIVRESGLPNRTSSMFTSLGSGVSEWKGEVAGQRHDVGCGA